MRVITSIGEQGLELPDGRSALLRPSFYAMNSLGTPKEIVEKFAAIHSAVDLVLPDDGDAYGVRLAMASLNKQRIRDHWREMLFLSHEILTACSADDLTPFIGEPGSRYASYRVGPVPPEAMLELARSLMQYGVIGPVAQRADDAPADAERDRSTATKTFDALRFVSKAVAHLGMSENDAWEMTLTGFAAHWEAKFGENKDARHIEDHDKTMEWLAKVNEKRERKQ